MWSNDYPHFNMTFPYSRANVLHHIGNLPTDVQRKLIRDNAIRLYGLAARLEENNRMTTQTEVKPEASVLLPGVAVTGARAPRQHRRPHAD